MASLQTETVTAVHHWTDNLFSFRTTRRPGFRFKNGHFIMIGLQTEKRPLLRAYSIASANYAEELEFFSIKVPDGPLTSRLQHLEIGDEVIVGSKSTGTLEVDNLRAGKNLYLLSTGTGLAPFLSIIRDPEVYEAYDKIILTHGTRWVRELAYQDVITQELPNDEFIGEMVRNQLLYYPTVTREPYDNNGRLTDLLRSGKLTHDLGMPKLDVDNDRFMLCGSPAMLKELCAMLNEAGFSESRNGHIGEYVIERAFVES